MTSKILQTYSKTLGLSLLPLFWHIGATALLCNWSTAAEIRHLSCFDIERLMHKLVLYTVLPVVSIALAPFATSSYSFKSSRCLALSL